MSMSSIASQSARLSAPQMQQYQQEGYLILDQPIFPQAEFDALKAHFEAKLAALPADARPENMDVPHFTDPALFRWLASDAVLDLIEPITGPDIALFSSHFICKPRGNGKRVPWHEDSFYWKGMLEPMEVVTVWLAVDPSSRVNGCMKVIPRTHDNGYSDYEPVDTAKNVFPTEIKKHQRDDSKAKYIELQPNHASLHDGKLMHGSDPNNSDIRRCGYTMRYIPTHVKLNMEKFAGTHHFYLLRGKDRGGNVYGDPSKSYDSMMAYRDEKGHKGH
jgi:hypothetical protein